MRAEAERRRKRRPRRATSAVKIEAYLPFVQLQTCTERLARFRFETLQHRSLLVSQQGLCRAGRDALARHRLPDRQAAAVAPAAATERFLLLHDFRPAKWTGAKVAGSPFDDARLRTLCRARFPRARLSSRAG